MNKIYACLDARPGASAVIDAAVWCARRLRSPLEFLDLAHGDLHPRTAFADLTGVGGLDAQQALLDRWSELDGQDAASAQRTRRRVLEDARRRALAGDVADVVVRPKPGELEAHARDVQTGAGLLVLGTQADAEERGGRPLRERLNAAYFAIRCPVALVPGPVFSAPRHTVLAFDGQTASHRHLVDLLLRTPVLAQLPVSIAIDGAGTAGARRHRQEMTELLSCAGFDVRTRPGVEDPGCLSSTLAARPGPALVIAGHGSAGCARHLIGTRASAPSGDWRGVSMLVLVNEETR